TLTKAVNMAQVNVGNAEQAALGAQQEQSEKTQLFEAAKTRVEQLLGQLSVARSDYSKTKDAAMKAAAAAHEAKQNANPAGRCSRSLATARLMAKRHRLLGHRMRH
ncbi:PREDICTED: uncharacterized protein LOC108357682, partial [Rhagoletis zephyria]|uniref:uncharacterized protein LOC108357682 n=1 Tax=Rhagoletis zephyria TaxID=28612 RepID=UPI0008119886